MYKVRGFTLIELMITLIVVGVIASLAIPAFRDLIERKRLDGAVGDVYEQLEFARSQAIKRSKPMLVDFNNNGTDWSVGITDKMAGCEAEEEDSSDDDSCVIDYDNDGATSDNILVRISGDDYNDITMSQATAFSDTLNACATPSAVGEQLCFTFLRGLANPGAYDFVSTNNNYILRVQVSQLGRIGICRPAKGDKYKDYKTQAGYDECL